MLPATPSTSQENPQVSRLCTVLEPYRAHKQRITRSAESAIGVENTRATSLSWTDEERRQFNAEFRQHLRSQTEVQLTMESGVTMARVMD
jgi:hypothetical protein